ncbi:hypothetical protein H0194_10365 [Corynebacterium incognita]|uniref:Methionine synthase n=1 Tax=Corynebacterium incognita TaxID=2754725 RepID=A0A7G7CPA2_9CORY|nr:hypothetical protein [Corynebacterium incognita]QNE89418.1 hypothetical protein H0194_10365 [Corynebacterium incognita]
MPRAIGLSPLPGTDIAQAADVVRGELGDLPHLPDLPQRGLGHDHIARTAVLLPSIDVERGPRGWALTARPQLLTRHMRDDVARDTDVIQEVWGETVEHLKMQVVGPWSLAAALELPSGHRAITDPGALRDLSLTLAEGIKLRAADLARRFHGTVTVQVDEPLLSDVTGGRLRGTTDFDGIPAVPGDIAAGRIAELAAVLRVDDTVDEVWLNLTHEHRTVDWEVAHELSRRDGVDSAAVAAVLLDAAQATRNNRDLDGLAQLVELGPRVGLGVVRAQDTVDEDLAAPRAAATKVARLFDRLGLDRDRLTRQVIIHEAGGQAQDGELLDAARRYRFARVTGEMLARDAGDL